METQTVTAESTSLSALEARRQRLVSHYAATVARYSDGQRAAIRLLYTTARDMLDTGGGSTCGKLLLGLYNGTRFPFDLTDLRRLDSDRMEAAMVVIRMDASQTYCEVHVLLDAIYADGRSTGAEFEHWAHRLRLKGKCKREFLSTDYGPHGVRQQ
jgi:hypothetical protein